MPTTNDPEKTVYTVVIFTMDGKVSPTDKLNTFDNCLAWWTDQTQQPGYVPVMGVWIGLESESGYLIKLWNAASE